MSLVCCARVDAVALTVVAYIPENDVTPANRRRQSCDRNQRRRGSQVVGGFHPVAVFAEVSGNRPLADCEAPADTPGAASAGGAHTCQRCGKVYSHHSGLSRHKRQCEGRLQEMCDLCGRGFYRSDYYKSHMKHRHGVDIDLTTQADLLLK